MKEKKRSESRRRYKFDFSISGIFSMLMLALLIMIWMFILGILVGRGYKPERIIPKLAEVLPGQEEQPSTAPPKEPTTLQPEELTFYEDLKKERPGETRQPLANPVEKEKPEKGETSGQKDSVKEALQEIKKNVQTAPSGNSTFRYIYQVASFKEEMRATVFRDKLNKNNIHCYVNEENVNNVPWFRVYVSFDGTSEETEELKSTLKKLGVEKPLLRSKKPI